MNVMLEVEAKLKAGGPVETINLVL